MHLQQFFGQHFINLFGISFFINQIKFKIRIKWIFFLHKTNSILRYPCQTRHKSNYSKLSDSQSLKNFAKRRQ